MTRYPLMAWNKPFLNLLLFILFSIGSNFVVAETCESLKTFFNAGLNVEKAQPKIDQLERLMGEDDLCAKNLLGQLVFEGVYLPKSSGYAKAIFSDLATKDYPPAMFNLAFVLSKEKDSDPEQVTTILLGVYTKYLTDKTYNKLAYKAADYGRQYIKNLDDPNKLIIERRFEDGISSTTASASNDIHERVRRSNEIVANFGKVLLVSAAIYVGAVIGSSLASSGSTTYVQNNVVNYTPNPSLYQIYSPGGGQFYALPLR
jgi:hypothetical protein